MSAILAFMFPPVGPFAILVWPITISFGMCFLLLLGFAVVVALPFYAISRIL